MKVLHLISGGDRGGAKTHVLSLLHGLNKSICADLVCYMEGSFADEARELGIPITVFPDSFISGLRSTEKLLREGNYDLVHCHGSRANFAGSILKRKFDIPFISTVHSDYKLDYLGRPLAAMTYGTANVTSLRKMDYRVCVSDETTLMMIDRGFAPNDLYQIYNGVDFSVEGRPMSRKEALKEAGCPFSEDDIIVGIGARFDPVKNVSSLVYAFAEASKGSERLRLFIAGEGQEHAMLTELCDQLGISDKVFFANWLSDMTVYYSLVDINTICSLSETFPYAVTEAARARIPTVASRVGGLPKLIIPEETGLLFEPNDNETFAKHLLRLANDDELRLKLGNAVYDKAKAEFSTENTCSAQLEIYESVLRRYRRKKSGERSGVVVCGAYGHGNAGDEAILTELLRQLGTLDDDVEITVISRRPKSTRRLHRVNAIARRQIFTAGRLFRRSKLFVSGGGSLIQDITSSRSLYFYLLTIKLAKKCGCKVQMYGCGIGPLHRYVNRRQSAYIIDKYVDVVTMRDPRSIKSVEAIGVKKPKTLLSADPVVSIVPSPDSEVIKFMRENGLDPDGKYICVTLRRWAGLNDRIPDIARALRMVNSEFGLTPVFLPMNAEEDTDPNAAVAKYYNKPCITLGVIVRPELAIGFMSRMQVVASMRLHALLYASSCGTPIVGMSYDPKVSSFIDYLGRGTALDFESFDAEDLVMAIMNEYTGLSDNHENRIKTAEKTNIEQARLLYNA